MLNIEQLKKIDPELNDLSDENLTKIRDDLYTLGELALEDWLKTKQKNVVPKSHLG